ncbi:hypothetical protein Tco_0169769 [Tanacetum coccineum]
MNRQFNIFHVAQSDRFTRLEMKLSKTLKSDMGKPVTSLVKSGMKDVKDDLNSQAKSLGKFCLDIQSMQTQLNDIQSLLESAMIIDDTAEGEKNKKAKDANPAVAQGEQQSSAQVNNSLISCLKPLPQEGPLSQGKFDNQIKELKRTSDLKAEKEKSEQELRKLLNLATLKAQAQKWTKREAKKAKMMEEYNHQISYRADRLPITKISYVVNSRKEATMKITREVYALASKKFGTSNNLLLQSLKAKFQWVINQAKRLGLPPPPKLATFGLTAEEKKRKRTELIKEVFLTEDVRVYGMERNLIPPPGVMPIQGLAINKPESGIFFMNGNTDIGFQRESKFHLTPTIELIRLQKQIKMDSEIAREMFSRINYVIDARSDYTKAREISNIRRIRVKDIVKEVEDYLKTYSSAGMDISWHLLLCRSYTIDL